MNQNTLYLLADYRGLRIFIIAFIIYKIIPEAINGLVQTSQHHICFEEFIEKSNNAIRMTKYSEYDKRFQ